MRSSPRQSAHPPARSLVARAAARVDREVPHQQPGRAGGDALAPRGAVRPNANASVHELVVPVHSVTRADREPGHLLGRPRSSGTPPRRRPRVPPGGPCRSATGRPSCGPRPTAPRRRAARAPPVSASAHLLLVPHRHRRVVGAEAGLVAEGQRRERDPGVAEGARLRDAASRRTGRPGRRGGHHRLIPRGSFIHTGASTASRPPAGRTAACAIARTIDAAARACGLGEAVLPSQPQVHADGDMSVAVSGSRIQSAARRARPAGRTTGRGRPGPGEQLRPKRRSARLRCRATPDDGRPGRRAPSPSRAGSPHRP